MLNVPRSKLEELKGKFYGKTVAVIGDMMLDSYYWGGVRRISPEAPVPVVEVDDEFYRFGGAANVALNIMKLGGQALPIGIIGYDNQGTIFSSLMDEAGLPSEGIIIDEDRPTTTKLRIIAEKQHVVRIDKESKESIPAEISGKILSFLQKNASKIDALILEDYNKGVLSADLIESAIGIAIKNDIIVTVDPKSDNFFNYRGVTLFKPNKKEAEDAIGFKIKSEEDLVKAGSILLNRLEAKYVLITLGAEGIALFEKGKELRRIPTKARKVADVSGAGDTVIATLTMALSAGADIYEACYIANFAAGIVIEEVGIAPIEIDRLFETVENEKNWKE